jgi:hypothetical protein
MGMLTRALLAILHAGAMVSVPFSVLAQDASRDQAEFDAAAGRPVFQNVPLVKPQAFSSRPRIITPPPRATVDPAPTGEGSADRYQMDRAAGLPVFHCDLIWQRGLLQKGEAEMAGVDPRNSELANWQRLAAD